MTVANFPLSSMQKYKTDKRIVFSQLTPDEQSMSIGEQSNSASYSGNANNSSSSSNSKKPTATTIGASGASSSTRHTSATGMAPKQQKAGKRPGRKPSKINATDKLERSRQSARECRARKKLRYQYLEELVINREKAVFAIRDELKLYKQWCNQLDAGGPVPEALIKLIVNEDLEKSRRQREQAEKALEKQQKRQQQEQKTSSSSSSISSSTSSTGSSTSSPPKSSPPPASNLETPTTSSAASSSNQLHTAAAHASRLLLLQQQQQQQQQQLLQKAKAAQGAGPGQVFRPQTLKVEPSSPTWSQIEHLLPKLSPTQPQYPQQHFPQQQQDQTAQPGPSAAGPSTSSQRTACLTRQEAFDMTTALQQSVQQQLQQVKGMLEQQKEQQQRQQQEQQQQQQQQQQYQHPQERQGLQSQLSIPESLSNFILSTRLPGSSEAGDQFGELLQQESLPSPQHYQGPQQYQPQYKHVPQSLVNQPQRTTPNYVPPPNFLDISNSTPNQRTLQQQYMTKAKSDPSTSNTADFLSFSSMDSFHPTTCSASPGSVPSFFDSRDVIRSRSLSNPSYMFSVSRTQQNAPLLSQTQGYTYSSPMPYTSSSGAYQSPAITASGVTKSQTFPSDSQSIAGPTLGFFSGNTLGPQGHSGAMLPTTSFPSSGPVESESPSSSDENLNEQDLFQFSTLTPHKRTLSDPILHGGKMRRTAPEADYQQQQRQPISTAGASPFFSSSADEALFSDPHTTLKNLTTTMRCFSSTRTSNTPSPSPSIGLVPMGVNSPSPTPSGGSASRSGSFSRSSPAPTSSVSPVPPSTCTSALPSLGSLPSLSSLPFYDTEDFALSPAAHAAVDTALDIFSSTVAARDPESGFPTVDCSNSSGLQASIDPIPEFLSYFSDIQAPNRANPGISTASSVGQGTSFLTQMDVNIPNIIDERLEDRDGSQ